VVHAPHQPRSDRVLAYVLGLLPYSFIAPEHSIEPLLLPDRAAPAQGTVDRVRRRALDGVHDLRDAEGVAFLISGWCQKEMNVIGHHHGSMQPESVSMPTNAGCENEVTRSFRKDPAVLRYERDEESGAGTLQMRQPTLV
jgi:hypothetical protein